MTRAWVALGVLCAGCEQGGYVQYAVAERFPSTPGMAWTYTSEDAAHGLSVRVLDVDSEPWHTWPVETRVRCVAEDPSCVDGALVRRITWSNGAASLQYYAASYQQGADRHLLSPPVFVASEYMAIGRPAVTHADDGYWTSTLLGFSECPGGWRFVDPGGRRCAALLELAVDQPDAIGRPGLAGRYWAAEGIGVVAFELDDEGVRWTLESFEVP